MPFWSSKNSQGADHGQDSSLSTRQDVDEQSRLLPSQVEQQQQSARPLRPQDSDVVSPFNLWSVRALRIVTVVLAIVALVWWAIQLISAFATPPGLHCRGSCFFAYAYSSLALANFIFSLIFFAVPSVTVRALAVFMAIALAVNAIIIVSVERIRHEEGWVGISSAVWATLSFVWITITDRYVEWGKAEEEERLVGHVETRRTLWEWSEVFTDSVARIIMSIAVLLISLTVIVRALDTSQIPPGTLEWVDGHKYQMHVYCRGNSSSSLPVVILEGGEDAIERGLWQFAESAVQNGSIARYCFADRPGLGWSESAPSPLTAGMAADALGEALAAKGERGPWVLAAAGVGAVYSRIFAARHASDVTGLLLIDPLHEDLLASYRGGALRGLLLWLRGASSPLGILTLTAAALRGHTAPDRIWRRDANHNPRALLAHLQEAVTATSGASQRELAVALPPELPFVVISSGLTLRADADWEPAQRRLARGARHWDVVEDAPHRVWDDPDGRATIEARLAELVVGHAA